MKYPLFDALAPKQTVSVTLNSDLYTKAKSMGINTSKVAEEAVAGEYAARCAQALALEIRDDLKAAEKYAEEHGSFSELIREHYETEDADGAI
jgi:post-segregation antitoxin (ccd killing protein)